ncbi:hypothetical protein MPER_02756 [Moniliophthora perniciosa FA553]|nr:hypothetical protein MPER_02756 [Moniliophthora perniciosa FA553]
MFGCCVAGRPLQMNLQQVDETHALFELPNASTINHVCVFLLGTIPFPDGYGATVHFHWAGEGFSFSECEYLRIVHFLFWTGIEGFERKASPFKLRGLHLYSWGLNPKPLCLG